MQRIGFDFVAISAGTARALYELCYPSKTAGTPPTTTAGPGPGLSPPVRPSRTGSAEPPAGDRIRLVRFSDIYALEQRLCSMSSVERARIPGLDPRRVDSIVSGVILVRSLLEVVHADQYTLCEAALREGLIADYAAKNRPGIQLVDEFPDQRRRSVVSLMRRSHLGPYEPHAKHVARLALDLFRGLRPLHGLPNADGELLEFAALLHDVGFYIAASKHHKHGQYLIENVGLNGFSEQEISLIAQTVRYHRKATPKESHVAFMVLPENLRRRVRIHAALLRVADGLDRTNHQLVRSVRCRILSREIEFVLTTAAEDLELELWAARRKADLLEEIFRRKARFLIAREPAALPESTLLDPE